MRALLFALILLPALAFADKPEVIDEADILRLQLAQARVELAKRDLEAVSVGIGAKYKLGPGDDVDPQTRAIKRATRPKATKPEAK